MSLPSRGAGGNTGLAIVARKLVREHAKIPRYIERTVSKSIPEAQGADKEILHFRLQKLALELSDQVPERVTDGWSVWSTTRAVARIIESTGSHGKILGVYPVS